METRDNSQGRQPPALPSPNNLAENVNCPTVEKPWFRVSSEYSLTT